MLWRQVVGQKTTVLHGLCCALTSHSSRTRFVASIFHAGSRAGRLNSSVRPMPSIPMSLLIAVLTTLGGCQAIRPPHPIHSPYQGCDAKPRDWKLLTNPPSNFKELLLKAELVDANSKGRIYWFQGNDSSLLVCRTTLNDPDCDQVARKFVMGSNGWVMSNDVNVTVCSSGVR